MGERRKDHARRARFEQVRRDKLEKLRRVCRDWSHREIESLSAHMTRLELKYDAWTGLGSPRSPLGA